MSKGKTVVKGLKNLAELLGGTTALAAATAPEDANAGVITKGGRKLIEAWHGSPHTFDKFDISKIGTGEGAQVYGHGLYFADAKETADSYKGMGRPKNLNYKPEMNGVRVTGHLQNGSPFDLGRFGSMEDAQRAGDQLDGSLYRTHIDVNPDTLLDWDKPLSEQSDQVKNLIEPFKQRRLEVMNQRPGIYTSPPETIVNNMTGGEWLDEMTGQIAATSSDPAAIGRGAQAHTSKFLHENGIPGIRYLDGMSRDGGEGTYNYVMFDDKPISIVERGNASPEMLGTLGAGTAAVMAAGSQGGDLPLGNDDPFGFTNRYHFDTLAQNKARMNEDGSVTTVLSQGVMYNGKIYAVPGYDRDTGRNLTEDEALQKFMPNILRGEIPGLPARNGVGIQGNSNNSPHNMYAASNHALLEAASPPPDDPMSVVGWEPVPGPVQGFGRVNHAAEIQSATQDYDNRRAQKADYWKGIRQSVIDLANSVSDFTSNTAFPALDKPLQGYMGLAGTAGSLMAGNSFPDAIQQGAIIAQQPTDQTAYQYGQTVTDALTPYLPAPVAAGAGALTNAGILMTSPF